MAVMLRALGIPSRVAVGFTQGSLDPKSGTYSVTTADAHAWVEVLFPGYGWIPFEPTPGRSNPVNGHIVRGARQGLGGNPTQSGANANGKGTRGNGNIIRTRDPDRGRFAGRKGSTFDPGRGAGTVNTTPRSYTGLILLILAALVGVAAVGIPAWKMFSRRRELARAHTPRAVALAAYRLFASRAADLGFGRSPGETMTEYRARLHRDIPSPNGDLDRLTRIAAVAAYSGHDPTGRDAAEAVSAGKTAIASVRKDVPVIRRMAGMFRPSVSG